MGGPLVLLPRDALQVWTGAYGPDGEDDVDEEEETDYWWVGEEVEDYADAVEVRGVSALILANGNSPTTFVPTHRLLLQRITWDPTADVVANALRLLGSIRWQHETTWVSQGPSYLFDAAAFGVRVGPDDRLDIGLEPGPYIVRSAYAGSGGGPGFELALTQLTPARQERP
jgi:Immunity protein 21